ALFLVFTIFMSWFTVSGRELLIGPIIQHTNRVPFDLSAVLTKYKFNWGEFSSLVKFIFYLSPVLLLAYQSRNKWSSSDKKKIILITGFFFPYLLGQFLSGSYWRHYNTVLIAYIGVLILLLIKPYTLTAKRLQLCF